ncbi:hypothetical protein BASA81_008502 [Batrachochytrium salamandrivorans]|nr:hypothetical protein BASA81_008502 [Batrachochytrium salamandrivorans]
MDHWQPTPQVTRWTCNTGMIVSLFKFSQYTTIRNSDILDQDFSWNQIAAASLQMSPRKAPGDDGIYHCVLPSGTLYACQHPRRRPTNSICSCSVESMWSSIRFSNNPPCMACAHPLSPSTRKMATLSTQATSEALPLINVGLKLVCKVLQMRIERFVETNNLLSYEQAGFRKREECVGQVVSLVRHHSAQTECWAKHPCSIHRYPKGIRYSPRWCTVMEVAEHGIPSSYSCLSQGIVHILICSSSGRITTIGPIPVPGLSRDTNPIRGLMYADDVAVFADSEQSLLAASTAIEQWANQWEMQFGVAKCGIISFTGHLAPRLDNPLDIRLHGQLVSRVESYKYLGVLIDSKLDHFSMAQAETVCTSSTPFRHLHPVLANHQLTVNYRSRIFSAVVMGKAYYGLELVGGNKSHLAPLQTTINKGIRLFTGARLSTAIGPLLVETGIGSLLTRSLVSRVRLLERSVTKRTPINAICSGTDNDVFTLNVQGQLVRSQRWFWSRRTKQLYRNRYWLTPQIRPKTVKQRHSFALMETLRTCGDSASLQKYVTRQLLDTSGFFKDPSFDQSRAHGTRYLMLARMDALWTARKAIQIGILDLDQRWLDGTVEHESMGTRHDNRALAARLADFLQVAYRQYQSTLWKYHRDRLVEVG